MRCPKRIENLPLLQTDPRKSRDVLIRDARRRKPAGLPCAVGLGAFTFAVHAGVDRFNPCVARAIG